MEIRIDQARFLNPVFMVKKHTKPVQRQSGGRSWFAEH
jgi:hypothetical protein